MSARPYEWTGISRSELAVGDHVGWRRVTGGELAMPVLLRLSSTRKGEIVCTGLIVGLGRPRSIFDSGDEPIVSPAEQIRIVTASALRIPLASIVTQMAREIHGGTLKRSPGRPGRLLEYVVEKHSPVSPPRTRPGAKGHPDAHWREVVERYREVVKTHPTKPTKALRAQYYPSWSEATVRYWLRVLRERGLLGRSEPGKPGEKRVKRGRGKRR